MSTLLHDNPAVKEAYKKYRQFNNDEELRALDEAHQKHLHDQATDIEAALNKGIDIGVDKGIAIGVDQGIEIGVDQKASEVARNMKNEGCDPDFIFKMTGLSKEEIERLNN